MCVYPHAAADVAYRLVLVFHTGIVYAFIFPCSWKLYPFAKFVMLHIYTYTFLSCKRCNSKFLYIHIPIM